MIKEVCVENFSRVPLMIEKGANRIELNNDLNIGGTTPSYGVIKQTINYAHNHEIPVVVMIRPRCGNFIYDQAEKDIMLDDIEICSQLEADGVVFGCLTSENTLDKDAMKSLIEKAKSLKMQVVMHMAFDEMPWDKQKETIEWLIQHRVDRILTHGGNLSDPIAECLPHLRDIVNFAKDRIQILPGGGINVNNVDYVVDTLDLNQAHGTKIVLMS